MKIICVPVFYTINIECFEFSQSRSDVKLTHLLAEVERIVTIAVITNYKHKYADCKDIIEYIFIKDNLETKSDQSGHITIST